MKRVGFVVHVGRPPALEAAAELAARLHDLGVATRQIDGETVGALETSDTTSFAEGLDLVVSVGGDGTFLRAAHVASGCDCPVLGVKVGRVGFLTEVEPEDAAELIRSAIDGGTIVEERLAVAAEPADGGTFEPQWALNEVILEKGTRHRLIRLDVAVDGAYVTTLSADGVIVSTPTGSTAYAFSAGGPIVTPTVPCLVVTPVAAHMVFDRSFVLHPEQVVTVKIVGEEPGLLSADGRSGIELAVGSSVRIRASERPARLVRRPGAPAFLSLVREKFGLPEKSGPGLPS